jgi:DNA-binding Xre family transcriptional regulator
MQWNLRMKAAERGIWKSTEMRRLLAEAGVEISAGKMSQLWSGTPNVVRLDELDVICAILDCDPSSLLIREPEKVAAMRPSQKRAVGGDQGRDLGRPVVAPRFGSGRSEPPV